MKNFLSLLLVFGLFFAAPTLAFADGHTDSHTTEQQQADTDHQAHDGDHHADDAHGGHAEKMPAFWSVIPFVALLLMVATGPLFYAHFWHKNYPIISVVLGVLVVVYYLFFLHDQHHPVHSFFEYFSFIALLTALFVASGGILIEVDKEGKPLVNIAMLVFGAFLANIIGTTGASMLLIRPFIRLNKDRIKPYHVVFFIFMVSNVGGCLTPIGDPPLFLGFLKGIPFEWTIVHIWMYWIIGIALLSAIFYFVDSRNKGQASTTEYTGKVRVVGLKNVIFLAITIGAVFIDPNVMDWVPAINYHGDKMSFLRELIMLATAAVAYFTSSKEALKGNEFNFEPIKEVAFLFIGIFATMMPALQLIGNFAKSEAGSKLITSDSLYWATGMLSGVLDNAPTYLNFLAAGMGKAGLDLGAKADVAQFVEATTTPGHFTLGYLLAISVGAVFFGAFTYIGNAPNFMVKAIAEQTGVKMPSFIGYIVRYSVPILLPVLLITWLIMRFIAF